MAQVVMEAEKSHICRLQLETWKAGVAPSEAGGLTTRIPGVQARGRWVSQLKQRKQIHPRLLFYSGPQQIGR